MTSFFRFFNRSNKETGRNKDKGSIRNRSLRMESLESRELLSVTTTDSNALAPTDDAEDISALVSEFLSEENLAQAAALTAAELIAEGRELTWEDVSALSSCASNHIIYLDFTGHYITSASSTQWNRLIESPRFSIDNDPAFNQDELILMYTIWQITAEYFMPLNINVITYEPALDKLTRDSATDIEYGVRVVVGGDRAWYSPLYYADGASVQNSFKTIDGKDTPAYVFSKTIFDTDFSRVTLDAENRLLYATKVAATVAREVGHSMGLDYEPRISTTSYIYNRGYEIAGTGYWWTSLMGSGYSLEHTIYQWNGSRTQNGYTPIEFMAWNNGLSIRSDEVVDSWITFADGALETSRSGVVHSSSDDEDSFVFIVDAMDTYTITISAGTRALGTERSVSSLYFSYALYAGRGDDRSLTPIVSDIVPLGTQIITFEELLTAGDYTIVIEGIGYGESPGFGAYGSVGGYTIQLGRTFVPTPRPGSFVAEQTGAGAVELSWRGLDYGGTYRIYYRKEGDEWALYQTTNKAEATFTNLTDGTYQFYVTAENSYGNESDPSDIQTVNVIQVLAPRNFTVAQINAGILRFDWDPVDHVTKYYVYRKNTYSQWIYVGESEGTTLTITNVANGTYTYAVCGVGVYLSAPSAEQTITVGNVSVPILSSVVQTSPNEVSLSWYPVHGALAYNIYRKGSDNVWTLVDTTSDTSIVLADQDPGTYSYAVTSYVDSRYESDRSNAKQVVVVDLIEPTGLNLAQTQAGKIELTWNPVAGATSYNVYRKDGSSWTLVLSTSGTSAAFVNLEDGTYTYAVSAAIQGYESGRSPERSIAIGTDETAPTPTGLTATQTAAGTVALNWSGVAGATEYNVYRRYQSEGQYENWVKVATVTGTTATVTELASGDYAFRVTALTSVESGFSPEALITVTAISGPTGLTAKQSAAETVTLTWNEAADTSAYNVYRQNADTTWTLLTTVSGTACTLNDVSPGNYVFAVSAVGTYESDLSPGKSVTVLDVAAPAALRATSLKAGEVTFSWDRVTGVSAYHIYQKNGDGSWERVATVSGATSTTLSGLPDGNYVFAVTAYGLYESLRSPETSVVVSGIDAPTGILAAPLNENAVQLSWDAVDGADSYDVYRKIGDSAWMLLESTDTTSTTIFDLTSGTHTFAVTAKGEYESNFSPEQSIAIDNGNMEAPATPDHLRCGNRTSETLTLSWDAVPGAVQYELQRKGPGDTNFTTVSFGNDTTYIDTGLDPDAEYVYRVRTVDAPMKSAWSTEVAVRTDSLSTIVSDRPVITEATLENGVVTIRWSVPDSTLTYVLFKNGIPVSVNADATFYVDDHPATTNSYIVYAYHSTLQRWTWSTQRVVTSASVEAAFLGYRYTSSGGIELNWADNGLSYVLFRNGSPVSANLSDPTWIDETPVEGDNEYILYVSYMEGDRQQWIWSSTLLVPQPSMSDANSLDSFWSDYALADP